MTDIANLHQLPPAPPVSERVASGGLIATEDYNTYPAPGLHMEVAVRLTGDLFSDGDDVPTVRYWRGEWWRYTGRHWRAVHEDGIRKAMWDRLGEVTYIKEDQGEKVHKPWLPSPAKVSNVLEPLRLLNLLEAHQEAPAWTGDDAAPGSQLVSMGNGLFDIATGELHPHTPHWFTTWSVPFIHDPGAHSPSWERYLSEVLDHDLAARDFLQEYMGYLLSGRTDLHKAMLIVGPPRAGKGVLGGVLTAIVGGEANASAPTLTTMGGRFGLKQMIGKPLAIIADARSADRGNAAAVEHLLTIIGGDIVTVECKGGDDWVGRLNARFVIMSNEVPRFVDASGAIGTRFVGFQLVKSFVGKEDRQLPARLRGEMSGIFNWALEGLKRLQERKGVFTVPRTQGEMIEAVEEAAAPVATFLKEEFILTGSEADTVPRAAAFLMYQNWCRSNGYKPANADGFATRVKAANLEGVKVLNKRNPPGVTPARERVITGVGKMINFS